MNIQFNCGLYIERGVFMKKCPACQAVYNDDILIKCTNCGADLVEDAPQTSYEQPVHNNVPPQNNYTNYNTYDNLPYKYCTRCGNQCDPKAVICVRCGYQFTDMYNPMPKSDDKPSKGLKFLCFLFPILGLVLYLVNMNDKPVSAKAYGKSALIGFIVGIILYVLIIIAGFILPLFVFGFDSGASTYPAYPDSEFFYSIIGNML